MVLAMNNGQSTLSVNLSKKQLILTRSSHRRCSIKKSVLKSFAIFTENQLRLNLSVKNCRPSACNFIEKRLQHRYFPADIEKFL